MYLVIGTRKAERTSIFFFIKLFNVIYKEGTKKGKRRDKEGILDFDTDFNLSGFD